MEDKSEYVRKCLYSEAARYEHLCAVFRNLADNCENTEGMTYLQRAQITARRRRDVLRYQYFAFAMRAKASALPY